MVCWELLFLEFLVQSQVAEMRVQPAVGTSLWREDLEMFLATEIILAALQRRGRKKTI